MPVGKEILWRWADRLVNLVLFSLGCLAAWLLVQWLWLSSFKIPSDSMEPVLLPGDNILVNKWVMGARVFNVWAAAEKKHVKILRLPGFGKVKRNDVLVFNFPYLGRWDSIGLSLTKYYVKRCVGLPGDTLEIRDCRYRVCGYEGTLGNEVQQERLRRLLQGFTGDSLSHEQDAILHVYPQNDTIGWTVSDFGPLPIPARGSRLVLDACNLILYRNLIEWEQQKPLRRCGAGFCLGDSTIHEYVFLKDYYFMAGDKVTNSQDSRYWGLLPEEYVVGKAVRIWKSVDPWSGKMRWRRVWKKID